MYKNSPVSKSQKNEKAGIDLNIMRAIPDRVLEDNNLAGIQEPIGIRDRGSP